MRLAVVIPLFNHETFIARTLESVLAQSRPAHRIIVIDDGSTDKSLAIARSFAPRGIEVIPQENLGVATTVRNLLALASTDCDLIATLDSDDTLHPDRFEKTLPVFEQDPDARLLVTGVRLIDSQDQPLPENHPRRRWVEAVWSRWQGADTDLLSWLGQANFAVSNSNFIARREFFATHPAKPYRFSYDYHLLIQAALEDGLRVVPEPLLDYRIHDGNTMNTQPAPVMREQLRLWLDLHHDLAPQLATQPALREKFYRLLRSSWHNVSSLHAGLLQLLLAQCAARQSPESLAALTSSLDETHWPELTRYPNASAVNLSHRSSPLSPEAGAVTEKIDSLRHQRDEARAQAAAHRELARLRQHMLASRRITAARTLGLGRDLASDRGKSPQEKLDSLHSALSQHWWSRHLIPAATSPTGTSAAISSSGTAGE